MRCMVNTSILLSPSTAVTQWQSRRRSNGTDFVVIVVGRIHLVSQNYHGALICQHTCGWCHLIRCTNLTDSSVDDLWHHGQARYTRTHTDTGNEIAFAHVNFTITVHWTLIFVLLWFGEDDEEEGRGFRLVSATNPCAARSFIVFFFAVGIVNVRSRFERNNLCVRKIRRIDK